MLVLPMNSLGDDEEGQQGACDYINGMMAMRVVTHRLLLVWGRFRIRSNREQHKNSNDKPIELESRTVRTFRTQKSVGIKNKAFAIFDVCLKKIV